jgi:hypothetical protein
LTGPAAIRADGVPARKQHEEKVSMSDTNATSHTAAAPAATRRRAVTITLNPTLPLGDVDPSVGTC